MFAKPVIVISQCIEHGHCRFDGSMIASKDVALLKNYVDFKPFCPEMGVGLPSPRESLRLVRIDGENHLIQNGSGVDYTVDMLSYSKKVEEEVKDLNVDGFILKSRSPSCGNKEVRLYPSLGKVPTISKTAKGIFAEAMLEFFPNAIFEDEGRFSNFSIREHFYTVIFTKADFKMIKHDFKMKKLIEFQSKNKYLFMGYSQNILNELGQIVANHKKLPKEEVLELYEKALQRLLAKPPNKGRVINVLLHIFGYFSKELSAKEKAYFLDTMNDYRESHIPLSTVMKVLYAWVLRFDEPYLTSQTVFEPFPKELMQVTDSGKGL